jgi:YD repeat-containing protein
MVCQTAPAAQPGGSLPAIPTTTYTYDMWGDPLTRTDTSGTTTRTWTYTYDSDARPSITTISGPGTSLPTVTQNYDSATGLPSTTTDGTNTISRAYDNLGRLQTYTDSSSNQSTYTYDIMNRVATLNDGKGTQTYTYQTSADERGLLTSISDSAAGTFTGTYDADGNLTDQHLPNGLDQCTSYDAADQPTERLYQSGGSCGSGGATTKLDYTALSSTHDQWLTSSGPSSTGNAVSEAYTYDAAGRLSQVQDTLAGQCTTRQYGYDSDSNRITYASTGPGAGGVCQTGTLATVHSYDAADRLTDPGVTYDAMGRTTNLPATDTGTGGAQTFAYYSNDSGNTITNGSVTHTAALDPMWRLRTWAISTDSSATQTSHYSGDADSPSWISENTPNTTWTRNIAGIDGALCATQRHPTVLRLDLVPAQQLARRHHGDRGCDRNSTDNYGLPGVRDAPQLVHEPLRMVGERSAPDRQYKWRSSHGRASLPACAGQAPAGGSSSGRQCEYVRLRKPGSSQRGRP